MNINIEEQKKNIKDFIQKYWMPIVGVIIALLVIFSVINIYKEDVLEIDSSIKYIEQDTIFLAANSIDTLNPISTVTEDSYYVNKLIFDSLFEYTKNLALTPSLVESYSVNTEKAYIDIVLKDNIKFHDGKSLTAEDVWFSVYATQAQGKTGLYYSKASKIVSVNIEGDRELRIYFKNNYDCSLDCLTFPVVNSKQYDSVSAFLKAEDYTPVGTGKYKFSKYDSYKSLELVPNENYAGIKAKKNVSVQIVPDKNNLSNLIENGTITCYTDKGSERKTTVIDNNLVMFDMISNEVDFLYFNTSSGIFKEKNARKAAAYAIDSNLVLEKGYMNDGVLSDTIYYPSFMGVADTGDKYSYDAEIAAEFLKGLGYEDKNLDGILEDKKDKDLTIKVLVNSNNANRIAAAKVISENLKKVGFSVEVNSVPWEEYQSLIKKKDFDILVTGYVIEEGYDLRVMFNGKNLWGYNNSTLLTQAKKLDRLYTQEEYAEHYTVLKELLQEELPYYPLCYKKMGLVGTSTFEAQSLPMFNNIYKNIDTWQWSLIESTEDK